MHKRNRWFVAAGLVYGLLGGAIALVMLVRPGWIPGNVPRLHGHIMLLGFILMEIYGIGLHVLPRFSGQSLYSERMADWQFWLANLGLPVMAAGWLATANWLIMLGGSLQYAAILLFGINIAVTVKPKGPWR